MVSEKKQIGILAEYDSPSALFKAAEKIRDAGYRRIDAFTPFPVHNLDKAMGLGPSYLPWVVLIAGITGASLAMFFMIWTSAYDYPLNIGGKPTWSIPAFIPITFECTVLFAGITAVFGMLAFNGLPRWHHPLFDVEKFAKATDDTFFMMITSLDKNYDQKKVSDFLLSTGAKSITVVEE